MGIKAANGVVSATEKEQRLTLYDKQRARKVEPISKHTDLVCSGMGPDHRVPVLKAEKLAGQHYLVQQEPPLQPSKNREQLPRCRSTPSQVVSLQV